MRARKRKRLEGRRGSRKAKTSVPSCLPTPCHAMRWRRERDRTLRWDARACAGLTLEGSTMYGAKRGNAENYWGPKLEVWEGGLDQPRTATGGNLVSSAYRPGQHSCIPAARSTLGLQKTLRVGGKGSRVVSFRIWLLIRIPSCR